MLGLIGKAISYIRTLLTPISSPPKRRRTAHSNSRKKWLRDLYFNYALKNNDEKLGYKAMKSAYQAEFGELIENAVIRRSISKEGAYLDRLSHENHSRNKSGF